MSPVNRLFYLDILTGGGAGGGGVLTCVVITPSKHFFLVSRPRVKTQQQLVSLILIGTIGLLLLHVSNRSLLTRIDVVRAKGLLGSTFFKCRKQ